MNEKTKLFVVLGVIVVIIIAIIGYNIKLEKDSEKILNSFKEELNSTEEKLVLVARPGCSWCQLFEPILDYYADKYEFSYTYLNTDKLVEKHFYEMLDILDISTDKFGTPTIAFAKDGKVTETVIGYVDERKLLDELQEHGFVSEKEEDILNYLNFKSLKDTVKSKQKSIIVVGQSTCSYCIKFKPILFKVAEEQDIIINYINYNEIEELEELEAYLTQFEVFQSEWGTPLTLITQNGKVLDTLGGYSSDVQFLKFLKENELIK